MKLESFHRVQLAMSPGGEPVAGRTRVSIADPFGNRLEIMESWAGDSGA